ncbi:MAG: CRTAC1 family protein [Anaerolineae bacterium]|nr:CRTAC1 family protein [Anaerolineae bacterium]
MIPNWQTVRFVLLASITGLLYIITATASAQDTGPVFRLIGPESGFSALLDNEEKVTGQAWGDYDQDGYLDLYVTRDNDANLLFHNNGDGTFSRSPLWQSVALPDAASAGASWADYDNDGWPDLYVMNWGTNTLFHNQAGQGFTNVTNSAGVGNDKNGKTASWGDYDSDGYLDLYIANWACVPRCARPEQGDADRLYHNNGDGTFEDVTQTVLGSMFAGAGFVASFVDFDNDGDQDIYLVNDEFINPIGNVLWRNDGPGCDGWCFTNVATEAGADTTVMGMGLATADYDGDGDFDFYFSNAGPMTLLQNQGDGTFRDVAQEAGVQYENGVAWGTIFLDYDNDGLRDLYLAVMEGVNGQDAANPLFRNLGDGTFANLGAASGAADPGRSIGVAYADFDQDGWVDLIVGNFDSSYNLYRNISGKTSENNWMTLKLVGSGPVNRDAVGARVTVMDTSGRPQMQEVINGASLGAGNALELYFGLGAADSADVTVRWPDGTEQVFGRMAANQRHILTYGESAETDVPTSIAPWEPFVLIALLLLILAIWGYFFLR